VTKADFVSTETSLF